MGDRYIIVEGGLVQNDPGIPILDLDVLDTRDSEVDECVLDEVERLMETAKQVGLTGIEKRCHDFIMAHDPTWWDYQLPS